MKDYLYEDLYLLEDKHWWHVAKRQIVVKLLKKYLTQTNPRILDLGCGTGKNIEMLSHFGETWGVDNTKEAIKYCKKRGIQNVYLRNAEETKLPAKSFDLITLLDVLEHTDDNKVLKESYRLLKKDGILIITVPAYQKLWSQWDVVLHHKRRYTQKSFSKVMKKKNLKIIKISYFFSFLVVPVYFIRLVKSRMITKNYSSDFKINSSIINRLLFLVASLESFFVSRFSLPFGTSIICVTVKNEK